MSDQSEPQPGEYSVPTEVDDTVEEIGPDFEPPEDLAYWAWTIIANVGHERGGWEAQDPEWLDAAKAWREAFHASLTERIADGIDMPPDLRALTVAGRFIGWGTEDSSMHIPADERTSPLVTLRHEVEADSYEEAEADAVAWVKGFLEHEANRRWDIEVDEATVHTLTGQNGFGDRRVLGVRVDFEFVARPVPGSGTLHWVTGEPAPAVDFTTVPDFMAEPSPIADHLRPAEYPTAD